ncbi:MAG: SpoIID/LytB domain-containing protein [Lachnospiraceae bacterium]|nr:SpoIID/LytB domain-containing protein [Lachnospiraceae bacterium]
MKVKRVKRKQKKREGRGGLVLTVLLFFFLFPFLMSGFSKREQETFDIDHTPGQVWVMQTKFWGKLQIPLEEYLVGMMASSIPAEYEPETLKAQAILLRSFCMSQMKKEDGKKIIEDNIVKEYYLEEKQRKNLWQEKFVDYENKIQQAILETKGMILVYEGEIINPPFFRMSNGNTRDIDEYMGVAGNLSFLKSISCEEDKMATEYIQYVEMTQKELEKILKKSFLKSNEKIEKIVLCKDNNGYVKEVEINGKKIEGELFRKAFGLSSSCFIFEKVNHMIEIQTKGIGHGFGFSQYEANQLAKNGLGYEDLILHFYENISLEKI